MAGSKPTLYSWPCVAHHAQAFPFSGGAAAASSKQLVSDFAETFSTTAANLLHSGLQVFDLIVKNALESTVADVVEQADLPAGRQARTLKMYYVYAIRSIEKNYIYVGLTNNPERRIIEHNTLKEKTTRFYAPFKTILIEEFGTRDEARKREKYLKSGIGKEYLKSV